jgi:hypothetical protein
MVTFMRKFTMSLLAIGSVLATAAPSLAASDDCGVGFAPASCRTKAIPANKENHFVHIMVSPYMKYRVVDSTNGDVVARGTAGFFGVRKTITGLYAKYYAAIDVTPQVPVIGGNISIRNN